MRVHLYAGWFWAEAGYDNFRCSVVQFWWMQPFPGHIHFSTRASGLCSVHSTLLECGALQLLCHYGKFLNTGAPSFAPAPEIVVVPVLGASSHGSQGVWEEEKVGWCHCSHTGWEQPSLQAWQPWDGLPGRYMALLGAPRGTNVTLQTLLLFPKLTKLSC